MVEKIDIAQFLKNGKKIPLFDVRTPAEFAKGHIPNANNLALFSDEERAVVGTLYKKVNPHQAMLKGLEFVGPKMRFLVEEVEKISKNKTVAVHCWRGGKRSGSVAWLLGMAGFEVKTIVGGYKAYRTYVLEQLAIRKAKLLVLGGKTGCGKTKILHQLRAKGEQVIDLEGLANHKGSAFGFIGEAKAPSVEQFENNLFEQFSALDLSKRIWVENESKRIGYVLIPEGFWRQMKAAPLVNMELPFEERLNVSLENYTTQERAELEKAFYNIRKRLGGENYQKALEFLAADNLKSAAAIALRYYDKQYQYMLEKNESPRIERLNFEKDEPSETAKQLIDFANQKAFF
ncbi:MAG: tRNA 2-selenouridine(34) synthase MnmH [Bacteroidota bacterium]